MLILTVPLAVILGGLDLAFSWVIAPILVNWWAPLFAVQTSFSDRGVVKVGYKLPWWLTWFDTFDADLDQGVRDGSINGQSAYWNRVRWLYRNPGYGFSYWPLGIPFRSGNWQVLRADEKTFLALGDGFFSIHLKDVYGLQFKFGWKSWNSYDFSGRAWATQPWGPVPRLPFVFSISRA